MNTENLFTEEEMQKLPKWAQSKAKVLQMRLGEVYKELAQIKDNPKSNTMAGLYSIDRRNVQFLKDNEKITFFLEQGRIEARIKNGGVSIYAQSDNHRLCVLPEVSNGLTIKLLSDK